MPTTSELTHVLKSASAWFFGPYGPPPSGFTKSNAPFEAADQIEFLESVIKAKDARIAELEAQNAFLLSCKDQPTKPTSVMSDEDASWWQKLWDGYPKTTKAQGKVPMSAKGATQKRFVTSMKKHKVSGEVLARACAAYVEDCDKSGAYIVGLHTLLGDQKAYWTNFIKTE